MEKPRYIPHDGSFLSFDPEKEIPYHLSHLVTEYPPTLATFTFEDPDALENNFLGLFAGPISVAYGLFFLSLPACSYASIPIQGKVPLEWAKDYLAVSASMGAANPKLILPVTSAECGIMTHRLAFPAVSAVITKDIKYVKDLISYLPAVLADPADGSPPNDEELYGRAGYLYLLRLVIAHVPSATSLIPPSAVPDIIDAMLRRSPDSQHPWRFFDRLFLGLGHGWLAVVSQILLSDPSSIRAKEARPWVIRMISEQLPSGQWNRYVNVPEFEGMQSSAFMQIGHGAPGMILGLLAIRPVYERVGDDEICASIDKAVVKAQDIVWERGILTKETCLSHGAAGNSIVLLDPRRKATFLAKSVLNVTRAGLADGSVEASSSPSGLHRGLIGVILAMWEYQQGRTGHFPSFNDV
ncbi:MAG: hypothetical protein TREMPRED_001962 [Tremellales sp. Tagirdzhanova-0007]|nr:MAG: hypothetical protein TREMPRED_001962 [Tremellales sp. Tagirdzhanova-0007]